MIKLVLPVWTVQVSPVTSAKDTPVEIPPIVNPKLLHGHLLALRNQTVSGALELKVSMQFTLRFSVPERLKVSLEERVKLSASASVTMPV